MISAKSLAEAIVHQDGYEQGMTCLNQELSKGLDLLKLYTALIEELEHLGKDCPSKQESIDLWCRDIRVSALLTIIAREKDPERVLKVLADYSIVVPDEAVPIVENYYAQSLEQEDLKNALKASFTLLYAARQKDMPFKMVDYLEQLAEIYSLLWSDYMDKGKLEEGCPLASKILDILSEISLIAIKCAPGLQEGEKKALLERGMDAFIKYGLVFKDRDNPEGTGFKSAKARRAVEKLNALKTLEILIKTSHKNLIQQSAILMLQYAEGHYRHGNLSAAQNYCQITLDNILSGSEFMKEQADAHNLLGRIFCSRNDIKNLMLAEDHFSSAARILEKLGATSAAATDHSNISGVLINLCEKLCEDYLAKAEEHLDKAEELGGKEVFLLHYRSHILRQKGNLKEARKCWIKTLCEMKEKALDVASCQTQALPDDSEELSFFIGAAVNLAQSCFSEVGVLNDPELVGDPGIIEALSISSKIVNKFPQLAENQSDRALLHAVLGRIFRFKGDFQDAVPHYKAALNLIEEHFKRTHNPMNRLGLYRQLYHFYAEFVDCCTSLADSDSHSHYVKEAYWGVSHSKQRKSLMDISFMPLEVPGHFCIPQALLEREKELMKDAEKLLFLNPADRTEKHYLATIDSIDALEKLWADMARYSPEYVAIRRGLPLSPEKIKELL